jgi:hypothetical protein
MFLQKLLGIQDGLPNQLVLMGAKGDILPANNWTVNEEKNTIYTWARENAGEKIVTAHPPTARPLTVSADPLIQMWRNDTANIVNIL